MNGKNRNLQIFVAAIVIVLLIAAGCGRESDPNLPTPTTDPVQAMQAALKATAAAAEAGNRELLAGWQQDLAAAEENWKNNQANDYTITVIFSPESTINQSIYTIHVVNGEIVEETADCIAGGDSKECIIEQIDINQITVPGLLVTAKNALDGNLIDVQYPLEFDPTYGYPHQIGLKTHSVLGFYWQVVSFTANE